MAQSTITIRMDENLKKQFDLFCTEVGMNMTTAICLFAKKTVREQRIPFEISLEPDPFYSAANMELLKKSIAQLEQTGGTAHETDSMDREK